MARAGQEANQQYNNEMAAVQRDKDNRIKGYEATFLNDANKLRKGEMIAANPYQNSEYLQNQNILAAGTSSAVNNAAKEALNTEALRTGSNTASRKATIADLGRQKMRTMTDYNAGRAAQDFDKNLDWQKMILGTDLAPAGIDTAMFQSATSGRNEAVGNLAALDQANMGMWGGIIGAGIGAAGQVASGFTPKGKGK